MQVEAESGVCLSLFNSGIVRAFPPSFDDDRGEIDSDILGPAKLIRSGISRQELVLVQALALLHCTIQPSHTYQHPVFSLFGVYG